MFKRSLVFALCLILVITLVSVVPVEAQSLPELDTQMFNLISVLYSAQKQMSMGVEPDGLFVDIISFLEGLKTTALARGEASNPDVIELIQVADKIISNFKSPKKEKLVKYMDELKAAFSVPNVQPHSIPTLESYMEKKNFMLSFDSKVIGIGREVFNAKQILLIAEQHRLQGTVDEQIINELIMFFRMLEETVLAVGGETDPEVFDLVHMADKFFNAIEMPNKASLLQTISQIKRSLAVPSVALASVPTIEEYFLRDNFDKLFKAFGKNYPHRLSTFSAIKDIEFLKDYKVTGPDKEGIYMVSNGDMHGFYSVESRKLIVPIIYDNTVALGFISKGVFFDENGLVCYSSNEYYGAINKKGEVVIPPISQMPLDFREGLSYFFDLNDKAGFVDISGNIVIKPQYEAVSSFYDGLAIAAYNSDVGMGMINKKGEIIIPMKYHDFLDYSEGFLGVRIGEKWGYVDEMGREVTPIIYDEVYSFENGRAVVVKDGRAYEISKDDLDITPPKVVSKVAQPSSSSLYVNDKLVFFEAYTIEGNNYFKLRDLAMAINGTEKQFSVGWDGTNNAIGLGRGQAYVAVGGELTPGSHRGSITAVLSNSKIFLDGKEVNLTAYTINGNNYFKLRDVGRLFNFGVEWNGVKNTIAIDTKKDYKD